ncbi:hypothetical protein MHK_002807 [Candidatus Magnetomorum sp. HK-1]|nr:hypothetical protein MHK_002807 [Candidatus Magnetomorum sp. HK-1]
MSLSSRCKKIERHKRMARKPKNKNGERNYSCLNYNKCLTEAAINNATFNCSYCEDVIEQSFNDLLKQESNNEEKTKITIKPQKKPIKIRK